MYFHNSKAMRATKLDTEVRQEQIAEAALAFELAAAAKAKFGGDAIGDFQAAHQAYLARIDWRRA